METHKCSDDRVIHAIDAVAKIAGGREALAEFLQVTTAAVGNWKLRGIPPKQCVRIEQLTAGAVTRRDLRPDDYLEFWPELAHPTIATPVAVTPPDMDDHRVHSLRRTHADSPYDHSDIDRRAEEGPTHLGRRASNGHAGDADSAQGV